LHTHQSFGGKNVYIVSSHHHVLKAWAEVRGAVTAPPNLITLDFHTDTLEPFLRHIAHQVERRPADSLDAEALGRIALVNEINFQDEASVERAIQLLRHDEHIQAATRSGILNLAFVVSFDGKATESEEEKQYDDEYPYLIRKFRSDIPALPPRPHHFAIPEGRCFILPHQCRIGCTEIPHNDDCNYAVSNEVLEAPYLHRELDLAQEIATSIGIPDLLAEPYILDLDLDFFHTHKSLSPDDPSVFHSLIRGALAITIATEPDWTAECWLDPQPPPIEEMLQSLYGHVGEAMASATSAND
jgi:hypothetical protein